MGQKVNPVSMRLQVNKDWKSKWFAPKKDYASFLKDDLTVRRLIEKKLGSRAAINRVEAMDITEVQAQLVELQPVIAYATALLGRAGAKESLSTAA